MSTPKKDRTKTPTMRALYQVGLARFNTTALPVRVLRASLVGNGWVDASLAMPASDIFGLGVARRGIVRGH